MLELLKFFLKFKANAKEQGKKTRVADQLETNKISTRTLLQSFSSWLSITDPETMIPIQAE
jgi:hypothetical protein